MGLLEDQIESQIRDLFAIVDEVLASKQPETYAEKIESRDQKSDEALTRLNRLFIDNIMNSVKIDREEKYGLLMDAYMMNVMSGVYESNKRIVELLDELNEATRHIAYPKEYLNEVSAEYYTDTQKAQFDKPYNQADEIPGDVLDESTHQYEDEVQASPKDEDDVEVDHA